MFRGFFLGAIGLVVTVLAVSPANAAVEWFRDLDAAKRVAAEEKKDLLINFTGTDWCGGCTAFKHNVLDRPQFAPVAERFVLVELEFPQPITELPEPVREKYVAWRDHYGIQIYPTILLADPEGKVYAVTGGIGVGPEKYVQHLEKLQRNRDRLKEAFAQADRAKGLERARRLDQALTVVRQSCNQGKDEPNGNPLVRFYRPQIDEIMGLDADGAAGLRKKYEAIFAAEAERERIKAIYDRMRAIQQDEGLAGAIRFIDEKTREEKSTEARNRLRRSRLVLLEWSNRHGDALDYARRLAMDESYSVDDRRRFRERIGWNLRQLKRFDEALAVYDELIKEAAGNRRAAYWHLRGKIDVFEMAKRFDAAADTWEVARELTKKDVGSSGWFDTEVLSARAMVKAGRCAKAAAVLEGVLATKGVLPAERAIALVDLALALDKVGRREEALAKADEAKKIAGSDELRREDPELLKFVHVRLGQMQPETVEDEPKTKAAKNKKK